MRLTREQAIALARGPASTATAFAQQMTHCRFERAIDGSAAGVDSMDHYRDVWVVTVHARVMTDGGLAIPPRVEQVYSVVIDAESGLIEEVCIGCAWVTWIDDLPVFSQFRD